MTYVILKYLSGYGQLYGCCPLIVPCEVAVRSVVPAIKALIATELVEKHGLKHGEVVEILGISQSAVSRYTSRTRGHTIRISELKKAKPLTNKITAFC
jgi:predicted transcriptional regulator